MLKTASRTWKAETVLNSMLRIYIFPGAVTIVWDTTFASNCEIFLRLILVHRFLTWAGAFSVNFSKTNEDHENKNNKMKKTVHAKKGTEKHYI